MNMNQITHCIHCINNDACHIFSPYKVRTRATATVQRHQHHQKLATTSLFIPEVESRTQGSRPRPRTQKKSEAKTKDSLFEDRHSRGQGQECSRPRPRTKDTSASALQKKKKVFTKIFQAISTKKRFPKKFLSASQNFNNSKNSAVLEPRSGQFSRT